MWDLQSLELVAAMTIIYAGGYVLGDPPWFRLTRSVEWVPAYNRSHENPKFNYGRHGVTLRFYLRGREGVAQFVVYTNWMLPQDQKENVARAEQFGRYAFLLAPTPADVGFHYFRPRRLRRQLMYEGDSGYSGSYFDSCDYNRGRPCVYDGSTLYAKDVFDRFCAEGEEAIWSMLKEVYISWAQKPEREDRPWSQWYCRWVTGHGGDPKEWFFDVDEEKHEAEVTCPRCHKKKVVPWVN